MAAEMYRRLMALAKDLDLENKVLEDAFRDAAANIASEDSKSTAVAEVYKRTVKLERLVSEVSVASSQLMELLREETSRENARVRKAFNVAHLKALVLRGVQVRDAAKQFLVQVLVKSESLAVEPTHLIVADAGALGLGLFAAQDVPQGRKIGEYKGRLLDKAALSARYLDPHWRADYVMHVCETAWIDAADACTANHTRYINHGGGDASNCVMFGDDERKIVIFTLTHISKGDQLFMDYGPDYWKSRHDLLSCGGDGGGGASRSVGCTSSSATPHCAAVAASTSSDAQCIRGAEWTRGGSGGTPPLSERDTPPLPRGVPLWTAGGGGGGGGCGGSARRGPEQGTPPADLAGDSDFAGESATRRGPDDDTLAAGEEGARGGGSEGERGGRKGGASRSESVCVGGDELGAASSWEGRSKKEIISQTAPLLIDLEELD